MWLWLSVALADPTLAVLDLDNQTGDAALDHAGPGIAAVLTTKLARLETVEVVERARLADVLSEVDLGRSGAVDPASAAAAGRLLGADALVLGTLFSVSLPTVTVSLRVVDVESGRVLAAEDVVGDVGAGGDEFFVLLDELAQRVVAALDVEVTARERIRLSQLDVERLSTLRVYGEALGALDRGDGASARSLLAQAIALEPGFTLAEETLAQIAQEVSVRRAALAHAAIQEADAAVERLLAATPARGPTPTADPADLARWAVRARLLLARGDVAGWRAAETARIDVILAESAAMDAAARAAGQGDAEDVFRTTVRDLVAQAGSDWVRDDLVHDVPWWPHEARWQLAEVIARLGRVDEAAGITVQSWQHPGPTATHLERPRQPATFADHWDAVDLAVVLARQEVGKAERTGNAEDLSRATRELGDAVDTATQLRERRAAVAATTARLEAGPVTAALLREEEMMIDKVEGDWALMAPGYEAFLARVERGSYAGVQAESDWRDVASAWADVARTVYTPAWLADARLAALLAYHEQVPPRDAADEEARRRRVEELVEGTWR